jgi:dinuclear metal center YbgI/SA1388 family protein
MQILIQDVIQHLETIAPPQLQEGYDNAGLITGNPADACTGILTTLDVTEAVVAEAVKKGCNLVVAHHPIVFGGLKKITGKNYVERTVIAAIRNHIAIYAIHTNLDNVLHGVNGMMAQKIGLVNCRALQPKKSQLKKLVTFVPAANAEAVRMALFQAGAGHIGAYDECSFNTPGEGTFKAGAGTNPFVGSIGLRHTEPEIRVETIFPAWAESGILKALLQAHPYEEVAYDIYPLDNTFNTVGAGLIGNLPAPVSAADFLQHLATVFGNNVVRHTALTGKVVQKVALCGGAGSFLIQAAIAAGADFYITADVKYHEFFDADNRLVIADIGHYETEQYSIDLLFDILKEKFPTFATLKTGINTNPVQYFIRK